MQKVRRDDLVRVMIGKDRGKQGKILRVFPDASRALVEGINLVRKHLRPTQDNPKGGFATQERPVSLANLARVCGRCRRPVRVRFTRLKDGTTARACARCGELL